MVGTQRGSWYVAAPCRRDDHDRERHECRDAHATEIHSPEVILHLRDEADALQGTQDLTQVRSQILFRRRQRIRGLRRFIQRRPAVSCNIRKKGPDDPCAPAEHRRGQEGHDRGFETKRLGDGWRRLRTRILSIRARCASVAAISRTPQLLPELLDVALPMLVDR
jgi:hypothetical protein